MLLGSPLPTWKQIINRKKKRIQRTFYEESMNQPLLLAESCMSIHMILNSIRVVEGKEYVRILVPDYFCNQTLYSFQDTWMEIVFYPIMQDMDPDWDYLKTWTKENHFDAMLFTHYFGKYYGSISRAKEICKNRDAILIEDCAHVLYPTGKMGKNGDFIIYSPHKQLPIADGAVLVCNEEDNNTVVQRLNSWIKSEYEQLPTYEVGNSWYIKKSLQKLMPIHRRLTYYSGVHYDKCNGDKHEPQKISVESYNALCDFAYIDYKKVAYIRRDNLEMMNYVMSVRFPDVVPLMDSSVDVPYFAVYSLRNIADKEKMAKDMMEAGFTILYWPDLPLQLKELGGHTYAKELSENIVVLPIHQDLKPQVIVKKFLRANKENLDIELDNVKDDEYDDIFPGLQVNNIPQERIYGDAKSYTEGWRTKRYKVTAMGEVCGLIQILEKRIMGIPVAVRVNRGPILKEDSPIMSCMAMERIRKRYLHPLPIIWAPYIQMKADNVHLVSSFGWKYIDEFGYPSAIVELDKSEDELHKNLKAFWRKNLNHAKKQLTIKYNEYDANEIISLYGEFLKMKKIPGIPEHILRYLFSLEQPPLEVLTAHNEEGSMIAYKVLYKHGNTGTSFIAWNTDEGRDKQARTLLIWSSMLRLKELGYKFFDLGGVDDINTEDVAKYKRGAGGQDYRLLGEFIRF